MPRIATARERRVATRRRIEEVIAGLRALANPVALRDAWQLENAMRALTPASRMPNWMSVLDKAEAMATRWHLS